MSGEKDMADRDIVLGCGCRMDYHTGYHLESCPAHDRRTRAVKVAAALQDLGLWLDSAGTMPSFMVPNAEQVQLYVSLKNAAKAAVKAAKAMIGEEE